MLYLIGLGLGDEKDITVKGLEAVKSSDLVYLEHYTSILPGSSDVKKLEAFYGKKITLADREMIESGIDEVLNQASSGKTVSILVVGDPFGATTHTDLFLRAKEKGIKVEVIHNASVINAVGCCGLQLYNFGQVVSIPLFQGNWKPESFYDKIAVNLKNGLHTLCLLDIKVKEPNIQILETKGKVVYDPPYFMTINQAIEQLLYVENVRKTGLLSETGTVCVGLARIGYMDQLVIAGTLGELKEKDFGAPLHSMIIVGKVHDLECEMLKLYGLKKEHTQLIL